MKIFTVEQIRSGDIFTVEQQNLSSGQLMERAAEACCNWLFYHCKFHKRFAVFCGNGNNGGDGFVLAQMLYHKGFAVDVFCSSSVADFPPDASAAFKKLQKLPEISVKYFSSAESYYFDNQTVIIDALFGTGLSGKPEGMYRDLIEKLNMQSNIKISVDVASGLYADTISETDQVVFKADYTLTFQFWKKSFLHSETGKYAGKVIVLDIAISDEFIKTTETADFVIDDLMIKKIFRPREDFTHKGTYGKAVLVAGSYGKTGAAVLATSAALKTGSGLTFTRSPECGYTVLQSRCPEAMFISGGRKYLSKIEAQENAVFGIGPGLGTEPVTKKALLEFLSLYSQPVILDADALNMLSEDKENLKCIPPQSVITPHPKEFERLFGKTDSSFERSELAQKKSEELQIYIVLKDHHTQIFTPDGKVFYNITGNAGLAKGGSGDILTGIITSLLAQKYSPENACIFGVWLHGKAADFAAEKYSEESVQPSDVVNELAGVFLDINRKVTKKL